MVTSAKKSATTLGDLLKQYNGVKVAVTGGAGFIGSALVEKLISLNAEVSLIDTYFNGNRETYMEERDNLKVYEVDITEHSEIAPLIKYQDIIFHTASMVCPQQNNADSYEILNTEIIGILNLLSLAVKNRVQRVVLASSSQVYGGTQKPARDDIAVFPRNTPAVAKIVAEEYCDAFNKKYGLEYTILRYFNVYGPGQHGNTMIHRFVQQFLEHKPFFDPEGENQTLDFIHIDDAINMTLISALKEETKLQTIDIGTGIATSMIELASIVTHAIDKDQAINFEYTDFEELHTDQNDTSFRTAEINKTRKLLQYRPQVNLETGIKKYIEWYKATGNHESEVTSI